SAVITYMVSYIALLAVSSVIASILGLDLGDSVTATISCLSNIGPAMGTTLNPSTNFSQISDALCLLFSCDMILGRLEILPVLLCFTRTFYKL
ncbi:MAG: potassium transporter TrkG, partial [Succinivibrio dextrinosolvens]|nr:potassium transporter TrkG [Succinivibrio dextrinosolvens]